MDNALLMAYFLWLLSPGAPGDEHLDEVAALLLRVLPPAKVIRRGEVQWQFEPLNTRRMIARPRCFIGVHAAMLGLPACSAATPLLLSYSVRALQVECLLRSHDAFTDIVARASARHDELVQGLAQTESPAAAADTAGGSGSSSDCPDSGLHAYGSMFAALNKNAHTVAAAETNRARCHAVRGQGLWECQQRTFCSPRAGVRACSEKGW